MIYKYPIAGSIFRQEIYLPTNAQILSVQNQNEQLVMWALVDTNNPPFGKCVVIRIYETGGEHIPASSLRFLATVQFAGGSYVLHVFEEIV